MSTILIRPRPTSINCIKFGHQWQNRTGYYVDRVTYACAICNDVVDFLVEDERKLEKIEKDVSEESNTKSVQAKINFTYYVIPYYTSIASVIIAQS